MRKIFFACLLVLALGLTNAQIKPFRMIFEKLHSEPDPPTPIFRNNINMNYIEQKLDHFDNTERRTWQMRYLSNDFYFKEGGAIFIFVGGEWTISDNRLRGGHMFDMARELNGYMFYTEHRFYGRSFPMNNLKMESLKYFGMEQALADLAHFIKTIKATTPGLKDAKVVLVGGSYSATMVTWFQRLYPGVADGSWASSAPLKVITDFSEYKEIMGDSIKIVGGQECYDRIERAYKTLEEQVKSHQLSTVREYINMCDNFDSTNNYDIASFFYLITELFAYLIQGTDVATIKKSCDLILAAENDNKGLGDFIKSQIPGNECIDYSYSGEVDELKDERPIGIMRQWYYQTCKEIGWFQTSTSKNQPFGTTYPLNHFMHICNDVYGSQFTAEAVEKNIGDMNERFGGLNPGVTNVFYTHGELDPWRAVGIQLNDENGAVVPLYSHCKDLASKSPTDSAEMIKVKDQVFEKVKQWTKKN